MIHFLLSFHHLTDKGPNMSNQWVFSRRRLILKIRKESCLIGRTFLFQFSRLLFRNWIIYRGELQVRSTELSWTNFPDADSESAPEASKL